MDNIMQMNLTESLISLDMNSELVSVMKNFVMLQQLYGAAIKEVRTKLEILDDEFRVKHDHNPIHHMEYRLKSPKSLVGKLRKKDLPLNVDSIRENLTDMAGVRVICNYIEDIYHISGLLTGQSDVKLIRIRDYIKHPKENGYRSLHVIVEIPIFLSEKTELVPVEVQIRTIAMDFWASLEHHLRYKSENEVSEYLRTELVDCASTISLLDSKMQAIYRQVKEDTIN